MINIRRIVAVWKYQMISQITDSKTLLVLMLVFFYIRSMTEPIMEFSRVVDMKISPCLFPIYMNDWIFPIIILLLYVTLICDAPFKKNGYLFWVARTGKLCWMIGQIAFLATYAIAYTFVVWMITIINLIPRISYEKDWGKVIMTLTRTDASQQFNVNIMNATVVENYTVIEATMKTIILMSLVLWLIGMIIFMFNYVFKNHIGVVMAVIIIFFDLAIFNLFSEAYYKFSPVSLMKISVLAGMSKWSPTYSYALSVLLIGNILIGLSISFYAKMKKGINIDSRREM